MPKAIRRSDSQATTATIDTPKIVTVPIDGLLAKVGLWHKRLNWVSGGMTLCYKHGVKRDEILRWRQELSIIDAELAQCLTE